MEYGVYTFAEVPLTEGSAGQPDAPRRMAELIEEMELADRVGLDVFALGEHHRPDFILSSPVVALAAGAARTEQIRLSSAVTVLSSEDPVRVFQSFATLDLISGGRAEIMAGRGSFTESFPLFGYSLDDYNALFAEKLEMLLALRANEHVHWTGRLTQSLQGQGVYPRPVQDPLPVWIAVGGTPQSVVRAGTLGLPLAVAIIGGMPEQFGPLVDLYRESAEDAGHDASALPVGINSHGFIAETSEEAREVFFPAYAEVMSRIGRERGWPPTTRAQFEAMCGPRGALLVGSPDEVSEKLRFQKSIFGNDRCLIQMAFGSVPHDKVLRSIELFGTEVVPNLTAAESQRAEHGTAERLR